MDPQVSFWIGIAILSFFGLALVWEIFFSKSKEPRNEGEDVLSVKRRRD